MSYMRGPVYIWTGTTDVHIWAEEAYDYWNASVWFHGKPKKVQKKCSGVSIPEKVLDELVVMRLAQMTPKELHKAAVRALQKYVGNIGCYPLENLIYEYEKVSYSSEDIKKMKARIKKEWPLDKLVRRRKKVYEAREKFKTKKES